MTYEEALERVAKSPLNKFQEKELETELHELYEECSKSPGPPPHIFNVGE